MASRTQADKTRRKMQERKKQLAQPASGFPVDLGPPPAHAYKQESPVAKKFGRFSFKRVSDKLQNPPNNKEECRQPPQPMIEKSGGQKGQGNNNGRNAERMAQAIHRMLMTSLVLRDPLLATAPAQHGFDHTSDRDRTVKWPHPAVVQLHDYPFDPSGCCLCSPRGSILSFGR